MPILLEEDLQRPLPRMYRVRQQFDETRLEDVAGTVRAELAKPEIRALVKPGMRIAVGVGSRGIQNLYTIVETTVNSLKELGAEPFIVSAMGSHGGGTEEGQREVLAGYGITEERLGVPVVTTVDTVYLGNCANGRPVWFDRAAYEADLIVPINRVKLHTDFVGPIQSGLCKMLVIGLGNHKGCSAVHEEAPEVFAGAIEETARLILQKAPVGFGIAILENAYDKTYAVEAVPAEHLVEREKELVQIAKGNMPYIMLDEADVIVCGAIGKDISGAGFDPNILGRSSVASAWDCSTSSRKRSPSSSTSNPCTPTPSPATVWATRRCPAPWTTRRPPSAWRSNAAGISTAITPGSSASKIRCISARSKSPRRCSMRCALILACH